MDPVRPAVALAPWVWFFPEAGHLGMKPKAHNKLHLRLNSSIRLIVNKYRKRKMKRTLKKETGPGVSF